MTKISCRLCKLEGLRSGFRLCMTLHQQRRKIWRSDGNECVIIRRSSWISHPYPQLRWMTRPTSHSPFQRLTISLHPFRTLRVMMPPQLSVRVPKSHLWIHTAFHGFPHQVTTPTSCSTLHWQSRGFNTTSTNGSKGIFARNQFVHHSKYCSKSISWLQELVTEAAQKLHHECIWQSARFG